MADAIREELVSRLAHQPRSIMTGMIKITKSATSSTVKRSPDPAAFLGRLDKLPLELLHFIFSMLDLKTLSSIARTCLRGLAVVESLPEFRDLIRHAPAAMTALGSTQLIRYHSAYTLHTALLSTKCESCGEYGPFLFLPTCERCCYGCLWSNQSLWVVPISQARKAFDLSAASVKKLPTMRNLPGEYMVRWTVSRKRQVCLVSVKAAKELALREGKSMEALTKTLNKRVAAATASADYRMLEFLQAAPLISPGSDIVELRQRVPSIPNDKFCGMASIPFPSLMSGNQVDNGYGALVAREWSSIGLKKDRKSLRHASVLRISTLDWAFSE